MGASELNFRVRNGNGWDLTAIDTDKIYGRHSVRNEIPVRELESGDPWGIRTPVAGVRGRSLRPLDQRAIWKAVSQPNRTVLSLRELVHHQGLEPRTR